MSKIDKICKNIQNKTIFRIYCLSYKLVAYLAIFGLFKKTSEWI